MHPPPIPRSITEERHPTPPYIMEMHHPSPQVLFVNPLTPTVKPRVIQSFLTFDSMDRTLKCDPFDRNLLSGTLLYTLELFVFNFGKFINFVLVKSERVNIYYLPILEMLIFQLNSLKIRLDDDNILISLSHCLILAFQSSSFTTIFSIPSITLIFSKLSHL